MISVALVLAFEALFFVLVGLVSVKVVVVD